VKRPFGRIWNSCDIDVTMDFKQWNGEAWNGWMGGRVL